jgi:6-phosphogluconolactonase
MRIRLTWMVMIMALVAVGFLMACSSKYSSSSSSNGLVVVPTQAAVMQSFSLNLANGHVSQINNSSGPPTPGLPKSVILDPGGAFAYVIVYQNSGVAGSNTGVASFQVGSDGKLSYIATATLTSPVAMAIDSAGKFLFVANADGTVSSFSVGSDGNLSAVDTATLPQTGVQPPTASALAVTPTVFPAQFATCSGSTAPSTENLYVADSNNDLLLNYAISSSGTLTLVPSATTNGVSTGTAPSGVAVDPCGRFAYVTNASSNSVNAYTICSTVSLPTNCPNADLSLQPVTGSPYPAGDLPGPLAVDPFGNYLYVVNTGSSQISGYKINATGGALTPFSSATATNSGANSIAIRSDGIWLFVANFNSANVSQYAITPASGQLTPQAPFTTSSNPTGVAVK